MDRKLFAAMVAVLSMFVPALPALPAFAANPGPHALEIFGVALKGASRAQMRKAIKANGLPVKREDKNYWVDIYDSSSALRGTSTLEVGYVAKTNKFAYAQYTFPGEMDTQLVGKVINMVSTKYGLPSSQSGDLDLGNVDATWNLGQGMEIDVSRGWPDTTTYLMYQNRSAYGEMRAEIDATKHAQARQQAQSQSGAF